MKSGTSVPVFYWTKNMTENIIKDREYYVNKMCYAMRHDFGLDKCEEHSYITSGMTDDERHELRTAMEQLYDNCFADVISGFGDKS